MALNLPEKMDFTMGSGSTEQKMDMTLDDIIKQNRKANTRRVPNKGRVRSSGSTRQNGGATPASRAARQRSVAARSSNLRQSKYAVARSRNGAVAFPATQAAGKKAFTTPFVRRKGAWLRNNDVRLIILGKQGAAGHKLNQFGAAGRNMKITVVNNGIKVGGQRFFPAASRRRNGGNGSSRQVQAVQPRTNRMDIDYPQNPQAQKPNSRTLNSLFAENKESRNTQPTTVQLFASVSNNGVGRRGGRNGFQGRRRQG